MPRRHLAALLLAAVACLTPGDASAQRAPTDASPHRVGTSSVDGVRIEYLDWGGSGPALVFFPGFGNSAHVFDGFAPRFTDRHRVVGVSRVGFGGSDQPERDGYTLAARVEQLRAVLDSLGLRRAVLVGHSLGGDEITAFATKYPARTAGVIYLDAALNHASNMDERLAPFLAGMPRLTAADRAGAGSYQAYVQRVRGIEYPLGEVVATMRFDSTGAVAGQRTAGRVFQTILANTPPLDYRGVRAPALALYAEWKPVTTMVPFLAADSAATRRFAAAVDSMVRPWVASETARFAREVPHARVVTFPSHHYQFLSHPAETERLMREFLAGLPPAAPARTPAAASAPRASSRSTTDPAADSLARAVTALADAYYAALLEAEPEEATWAGLSESRHDRVNDNALTSLGRRQAREDAWLDQVRRLPADRLVGRPEWVTLGFLRERLESAPALRVCRRELWTVDQMSGWPANFSGLAQFQPVGSDARRAEAVARARAMPAYIATDIANLREGVRRGYTSPRGNVERVLAQIDGLLAVTPGASPFLSPAQRDSAAPADFRRALDAVVAGELYPALRRYRDFLRAEYLPAARRTTAVADLPDGAACYRASVRRYTGLDLDPREIHEIGLREMARIQGEMRVIAERSFGTRDVPALLARLRADSQYTFRSREEVVAVARAALERARAGARPAFGLWPAADVVVAPYLPFEEGSGPDSYVPSTQDGSRPGRYRINTANPTRKPRAGLESTAFHETIPGHHLQFAIAMERPGAHPLTVLVPSTGFLEGWGLYAERLAAELGLFSGDVDRLGQLSNEAFRAARLVVDPGLHALGWSRQQAVDYMLQNIARSPAQVELEVDRYIITPGQATAYMVGQLEILRLREQARAALGPRFDLRAFHDRVLEDGALTLPMLRAKIERWIADEQRRG
jgi:uncharacterized protein (DUF885 family)/pimeloyl-ACP methyl ester carboxylesterase